MPGVLYHASIRFRGVVLIHRDNFIFTRGIIHAGLSPSTPVFGPRWRKVRLVVDWKALGRFFFQLLDFLLLFTMPTLLHTDLLQPQKFCVRRNKAAHYRTLGPNLWAWSLTRHVAGLRVKLLWFTALCSDWERWKQLCTFYLVPFEHSSYIFTLQI
jgi:hypothetical protein